MAGKWIKKAAARHYANGTSIVRSPTKSDDEVRKDATSQGGLVLRSAIANDEDANEMVRQGNRGIRDIDNSARSQDWSHNYNKGTKKVPGKGSKDTVPAMLTPGEAVLNKEAAKKMGRDKIMKANAAGTRAKSKLYKD